MHFRPIKNICSINSFFVLLMALVIGLAGQYLVLRIKNEKIESLSAENASLREQIGNIGNEIVRLNESQEEIRSFQRQMNDAITHLDNLSVIKLIKNNLKPRETNYTYASKLVDDNYKMEVAKLNFSVEQSKFDNTALLAKSLAMQNMLNNVPTLIPTHGYVSSGFGYRTDPFNGQKKRHDGIDIVGPWGSTIYAPADGTVSMVKTNDRDFGKLIEIAHQYSFTSRFAHLSRIFVSRGQKVKKGQAIGSSGATGQRCQGAHLHYEIQQGRKKLNPKDFLLSKPPSKESLNI